MTIAILEKAELNPIVQEQVSALFKQLNADIRQLPLNTVFDPKESFIFVYCQMDGKVVGMASMALYKVISGYKGMVEDVVVDNGYQGKGIGRKLMERLLEEGEKRQLHEILLFTGHHRLAAINLYKSLGFQLKESGLYTLRLH